MDATKSCGCGLVTTFAPPVWNPDQNFLHSEWMHWRWAGTTCVDYVIVVTTINMAEIGNLLKGFRGCLESPLEPT
jgi:hypothetical protein